MKAPRILAALALSVSLIGVQAFAQSTTAQTFDVYVDGGLVSSGAADDDNVSLTFQGTGTHAVTVSKSGTATTVFSTSYYSTVAGQVAHLTIDGTGTITLY